MFPPFYQPHAALRGRSTPRQFAAVKYWVDPTKITGKSDGAALATTDVVDQSASANGAWASISTTKPKYKADVGNGRPGIEFTAADSTFGKSASSVVVAQRHYVFVVVQFKTLPTTWRLFDRNTVNGSLMQGGSGGGVAGGVVMYAGSASAPADKTIDTGCVTLLEGDYNGASSAIREGDNTAATGSPGTLAFSDGVCLGSAGNQAAGFFADAYILDFIVADSTLTAGQRNQIRDYLKAKHAIVTRSFLLADGNSLTAEPGISPLAAGESWPLQLQTLLGGASRWRVTNVAVSGQTTAQMNSDAATQVDPLKNNWAKAVCFAWEGTNHIVGGADAATTLSALTTYVTDRETAGYTVIPVSIIERGTFTSGQRAIAASVNASLRTTYDRRLLDLPTLDSGFTNSASAYYNGDAVHLVLAGQTRVAQLAYAHGQALGYWS